MAVQGFGISVTFSTGFLAYIKEAEFSKFARKWIDSTNNATAVTSGSVYETGYPSKLVSPGELDVTILSDPTKAIPIGGALESITLTYPIPVGGSSAKTFVCSGCMLEYGDSFPIGDNVHGKAKLKFTGPPTVTLGT